MSGLSRLSNSEVRGTLWFRASLPAASPVQTPPFYNHQAGFKSWREDETSDKTEHVPEHLREADLAGASSLFRAPKVDFSVGMLRTNRGRRQG